MSITRIEQQALDTLTRELPHISKSLERIAVALESIFAELKDDPPMASSSYSPEVSPVIEDVSLPEVIS